MKKLLVIVILGLLLSGNAYAEVLTWSCKESKNIKWINWQLDLKNKELRSQWLNTKNKQYEQVAKIISIGKDFVIVQDYIKSQKRYNPTSWEFNYKTNRLYHVYEGDIGYYGDCKNTTLVAEKPKKQKALTGCIKGDCYNGQGTEAFENGYKYVGEFKDGKRHGQGTATWASGQKHVGEFKDGLPNGQGTETFPNGYKYVGEFKDGKRHGRGTYTWPYWKSLLPGYKGSYKKYDGTFSKYVGEFKNGLRHGKGTQTYPDGYKYVGEFKDDEKNGQGIETLGYGAKFIGEFKDDHRILSLEDYKKLAEENNILITGDYIYLLAAYGGAPEPDNLSHYYNFNNALGIANDVYRRGLRYVFSPKSPSTLKKLTFKKERNIRTRNEFTSKRTKNFRSFQFTAEYEDNITVEIFVEYKKKTKNFKKAEEKALYYSNMYGQMPHFLKKYNKRIFIHEYISNDDEWFHELGKWWVDDRSQEFHISKNAKCKNKKEYMERDLYLHTYKQSYSECALVMIHELAHVIQDFTSVIPPSKWVKAVKLDNKKYCSRYAKKNDREDFAESLVCWIVLRHKLNKIGIMDFKKINKFMPNRIKFFDELNLNVYPM